MKDEKTPMNFQFDECEDDDDYALTDDALGACRGCLNAIGMMIVMVLVVLLVVWAL